MARSGKLARKKDPAKIQGQPHTVVEDEAIEAMKEGEKLENYASDKTSDVYEYCAKLYPDLKKAYENRNDANDGISEYWNIYNAKPDSNQTYQGNSKCYVPVTRDAINARARRALKQLFPNKYNHVDAVGTDGVKPMSQLALLEHYIRQTHLKSIVRSLLVAGDITGQWNLYIDWRKDSHSVIDAIRKNPIMETAQGEEVELPNIEEEVDEYEDKEVITEGPDITDFATEDLVVLPPTVTDIEKAEATCLKLRMSKSAIQRLIDDGVFLVDDDSDLGKWMAERKGEEKYNPEKRAVHDAGLKTEGNLKYALIYEAHIRYKFEDGKPPTLAYVYYAGENEILGIIKAPQWSQRRPIISAPVERVSGSFFGISKIEPVKFMQWNLNDFWNMGQDSAMYSMLPIVMTNPEKNPNYAMMVIGLAAVWPTSPQDTQFANFPQLYRDSLQMCGAIKQQIYESLDVNEMMMGAMPKGRKNNALVGAQMQESSISVIDHAERFEEEILNPLMERMFEYDCQFRDTELTIVTHGEVGVKAEMSVIPVQQWGVRYFFQWTGTDFVMNMQRMQQQIATMNVLRGIPPQQLNGRRLDIAPILESLVQNVFGTELGGRILIDDRNKFTIDPQTENEMLINGIDVEVHQADDDGEHIRMHQEAARSTLDPGGLFRNHIEKHMQQMQGKRQMAMASMMPQPQPGQPGVPGGSAPGVAGTPRPGAIPQGPRPGQQPPGAIHPDQMMGAPGRG